MMVFKITLTLTSTNSKVVGFKANLVLNKLYFYKEASSIETKFDKACFESSKNSIDLWHIAKFCTDINFSFFQDDYIDFVKTNIEWLENNKIHLCFYYEIYYSGDQCNFELEPILFPKLNISLPISVYKLSDLEIFDWENEIFSNQINYY